MAAEPGDRFNACEYLLDRRVKAGDGDRLAITGSVGQLTYAQLLDLVQRTAAGLREIGLEPEQRLVMFMSDSPGFVAVYLAAMRMGAIPVPVSTMLRAGGLSELLRDSRARLLAVTPLRRGHPRRHRDDRDAAHLPVQHPRAGAARYHRRRGAGIRAEDPRRARRAGRGTPGTLYVRGASAATGYWSRYDASRQVFQGEWLRTGDTNVEDADGYYTCLGRTDDMLKVSGIGRGAG